MTRSRIIEWDGQHLPDELHKLPLAGISFRLETTGSRSRPTRRLAAARLSTHWMPARAETIFEKPIASLRRSHVVG